MVDRRLVGGGTLFAALSEVAIAGRRQIHRPARQPDRAKRTAVVELRYGSVEIFRPRDEQDRTLAKTVRLWLVDVREVNPPADVEPLHWRLVTTHEITDTAKAWQVVGWYQARWVIEQLFRVMKSQGLQLEDSQLCSAERLVKLAAPAFAGAGLATKAACIDIQLTQERDGKDRLPASNVFTEPEIETLEALCPTLEGKTVRQHNLHPVASLAWAAWIIARLGGWNCYYKPPGPITMRRGMEQFYQIHRGRQLEMMLKRDVRIPWCGGGGPAIDRQHMPPGAGGTGPIRPAFDDLRCGHLFAGKEPPGSLFACTVAGQPAQTHRLAQDHLFDDRAPPLSRRRSPNVPSDISMAAPVTRLTRVRESYSRRVGQTKNAAALETFRTRHQMCACPRAEAGGPTGGSTRSTISAVAASAIWKSPTGMAGNHCCAAHLLSAKWRSATAVMPRRANCARVSRRSARKPAISSCGLAGVRWCCATPRAARST